MKQNQVYKKREEEILEGGNMITIDRYKQRMMKKEEHKHKKNHILF
jgi:hypothetical protein